jgi:hypothetical protein
MSKKLFESDFLTASIPAVFKQSIQTNNTAHDELAATQNGSENTVTDKGQPVQTNFDWGSELAKRLEANKNMSKEARSTDYDIESKFFKEYFNTNWDPECAKQLMLIGDPLRKALKGFGFKKRMNPILGFISLRYVQDNLIKTKLLNVVTFKAIYKAVLNRWVADSEFFKANAYNIIYCRDLYTKPLEEIEAYLKLQRETLSPKADVYKAIDQYNNQKTFLVTSQYKEKNTDKLADAIAKDTNIKVTSVKNVNAKLNSYSLAEKIAAQTFNIKPSSSNTNRTHLSSKAQQNLADKLNTPSQILAAIQFLSLTTESEVAKKALSNEKFGAVSTENLIKATIQIKPLMPKGQLQKTDADSLAGILLGKL